MENQPARVRGAEPRGTPCGGSGRTHGELSEGDQRAFVLRVRGEKQIRLPSESPVGGLESSRALCLCKAFFLKEHPSGEQGGIIFLDTPMYNKNVYLVTFASLHPEQLFSSSKHSSSRAGKETCSTKCLGLPAEQGPAFPARPPRQQWVKPSQALGSTSRAIAPREDRLESPEGRKSKPA